MLEQKFSMLDGFKGKDSTTLKKKTDDCFIYRFFLNSKKKVFNKAVLIYFKSYKKAEIISPEKIFYNNLA